MLESLSPRELEVLKQIIEGATNLIIAKKLYISVATTKAHVSSIFRKLNVNNRVVAAVKGAFLLKDLEEKKKLSEN